MSRLRKETREHYEKLKDCRDFSEFEKEGWSCADCPLCLHYIGIDGEGDCEGCPVKRATGVDSCVCTPWGKMNRAIKARAYLWVAPLKEPLPEVAAMADFLESLDWEGVP